MAAPPVNVMVALKKMFNSIMKEKKQKRLKEQVILKQ